MDTGPVSVRIQVVRKVVLKEQREWIQKYERSSATEPQVRADYQEESNMERSRLIQRLKRPYDLKDDNPLKKISNAFAFGGGLKNGGLTPEGAEILAAVCTFDYMGAAEYEWGAVPEALAKIGDLRVKEELASVKIHLSLKDAASSKTIHIWCKASDVPEVSTRIGEWAKKEPGYPSENRDMIGLARTLSDIEGTSDEPHQEVCGWLELNNGFLFTTDDKMAERFDILFEMEEEKTT